MTMERIHWIYTPLLLATICTTPCYITGLPITTEPGPTLQINITDIITDLQTTAGNESSTSNAMPQYSTTIPSEVPSLQPGGALNTSTVYQTSSQNLTTTSVATTTTVNVTSTEPPTMTAFAETTIPSETTIASSASTTTPILSSTMPTTLKTTLPTSTATSHPSTSTSSSTTPQTSAVVKTPTTQSIIPVHEVTLPLTTTPRRSTTTTQGAPTTTTTRESTHISDNLTTKHSGDWNIIGISGNSFTGKILLPIAVGTAFSVIIIAVAYCYCSRRGSNRAAKSSRNGVHRMTSNDRVMLLADSSEDEF
ncbi:cell wall protein DAN4-like [Lytechinus variegatus]|uniref:cell wall protein DAN4-like n=1 Tax=Lytechinus variegatus TaxID=7654 RepID=UPI001BB0E140|nr:cell wall protein DAN4-like [Lytechinus variegatus]